MFSQRSKLIFFGLCFLFGGLAVAGENTIRVRIFSRFQISRAHFSSSDGSDLLDNQASVGPALDLTTENAGAHLIESSRGPVSVQIDHEKPRRYQGKVSVSHSDGKLVLINIVSLEDYVEGVLESEGEDMTELDALLALSVVIRSYSLVEEKRHVDEGHDFCDLTHCQVYRGLSPNPRFSSLVKRTSGRVLEYKDKIIPAYYHSCCGGKTERVDQLWNDNPRPYLISVSDKRKDGEGYYCSRCKQFRWKTRLRNSELKKVLIKQDWMTAKNELRDVQIKSTSDSGRVTKIKFVYDKGSSRVSGSQFHRSVGQILGWNKIKSTWFTVTPAKDGRSYLFEGKGFGHGVGFCQCGADGMARVGYDYREILLHYFPKTTIATLNG